MKNERLKQLEQLIAEKGFVTVQTVCETFNVHVNTARSDIKELVRKGVAEKCYGGVSCVKTALPSSFVERDQTKRTAKEEIGIKAARLLEDGDVIFVDSGTTTAQLLSANTSLPEHLTIISNNFSIAQWVMNNTNYSFFMLPGKGERQLNSFSSLETIESVKHYNFQKAFLGCRRISLDGSLTSASSVDAKIKEAVIQKSQRVYLMADTEKIGTPELYSFSKISQVDCWVCDELTPEVVKFAENNNVELL